MNILIFDTPDPLQNSSNYIYFDIEIDMPT